MHIMVVVHVGVQNYELQGTILLLFYLVPMTSSYYTTATLHGLATQSMRLQCILFRMRIPALGR